MFEEMIMVEGQPSHWQWNSGAFKSKMLSSILLCSVPSTQMEEKNMVQNYSTYS